MEVNLTRLSCLMLEVKFGDNPLNIYIFFQSDFNKIHKIQLDAGRFWN